MQEEQMYVLREIDEIYPNHNFYKHPFVGMYYLDGKLDVFIQFVGVKICLGQHPKSYKNGWVRKISPITLNQSLENGLCQYCHLQ